MKHIIISADNDLKVYSVPDQVADHLQKYCLYFCSTWLRTSPDAQKYRQGDLVCYNEEDFIDYLNEWVFPSEKSVFVANLGWINPHKLPETYRGCPRFNF